MRKTNGILTTVCLVIGLLIVIGGWNMIWSQQQSQTSKALPSSTPPKLIFAETLHGTTTIWTATADMLEDRTNIYSFQHAYGWDGQFSFSPDKTSIAFISVTEASGYDIKETTLNVLDINRQKSKEIDNGVYLYVQPIWSPDSETILYERKTNLKNNPTVSSVSVFSIRKDGSEKKLLFQTDAFDVLLIGIGENNAILYYQITAQNKDIYVFEPQEQSQRLVKHFVNESANDFQLSPDRKQILFTVLTNSSPSQASMYVLNLIDDSMIVSNLGDSNQFSSPIWSSAGGEILSEMEGGKLLSHYSLRVRKTEARIDKEANSNIPVSTKGKDKLLSVSSEGRFLVLRNHASSTDYLNVIDLIQQNRLEIPSNGWLQFVGWLLE